MKKKSIWNILVNYFSRLLSAKSSPVMIRISHITIRKNVYCLGFLCMCLLWKGQSKPGAHDTPILVSVNKIYLGTFFHDPCSAMWRHLLGGSHRQNLWPNPKTASSLLGIETNHLGSAQDDRITLYDEYRLRGRKKVDILCSAQQWTKQRNGNTALHLSLWLG